MNEEITLNYSPINQEGIRKFAKIIGKSLKYGTLGFIAIGIMNRGLLYWFWMIGVFQFFAYN